MSTVVMMKIVQEVYTEVEEEAEEAVEDNWPAALEDGECGFA